VATMLAIGTCHVVRADVEIQQHIEPGKPFLVSDGTTYDARDRFRVNDAHRIPEKMVVQGDTVVLSAVGGGLDRATQARWRIVRGWGKPELTARSLRDGEEPGNTVLHTGDIFRTDEEGLLYFVARKDDIFKCKGEKVSPKEVEDALCELPEVAEVAVIGVEDATDGMAVKAFVVPSPGTSPSEQKLRQYCRGCLETFMVPKFIEFRDSLPKTGSGKICKKELSQSHAQRVL